MNIEGLEIRVNRKGGIVYYKDDVVVGRRCTKCGEDKEISEFGFQNKKKNTYLPYCKECSCKKTREWTKNNIEKKKEYDKRYAKENAEHIKERKKQWYKENIEHIREYNGQYQKNNREYLRDYKKRYAKENTELINERAKRYYKENIEKERERLRKYAKKKRLENPEKARKYHKEWYKANIEKISEQRKQRYQRNKKRNIENITKKLEQINSLFKSLNITPYGYVYKITGINNHYYIGQTVKPLNQRYHGDVIKGWIKERVKYENQKFKEELKEENLTVDVIDVAFCKYHLDKLEAYYIDKYDSCNNGYNNNAGYWNRNDGLDEFNEILKTYNLQYIDGKIIKNTHQDR